MAATVQTKTGEVLADMNTTPLIDVMLVLLTLLIITLPMQTHAIKIALPHGMAVTTPPTIVTIGVEFDGTASWNGQRVDRTTLDAYLASAARKNPQPEIHIRSDPFARYDAVTRVLVDAARAGENHISFDNTAGD
jgi:biopolymer transport protein ExbD